MPIADVRRGPNERADQYEIDGHERINSEDPLKLGEAILYAGHYHDDCARKDDPLGWFKAGDLIEFKGPGYDKLMNADFSWFSVSFGLLDQAYSKVISAEGSGRRIVYLVAEPASTEQMKMLFNDFTEIDVFNFPPVVEAGSGRRRSQKFFWLMGYDDE